MRWIYKSLRVGKNGKLFWMYKFRTMIENAESMGGPTTVEDDWRITKTGKFLRKYKIDELPQLWNVLKGDMRLVGPRPEVLEVINLMSPEEREIILSVKPGMTDLASIKFRNEGKLLKGCENPHQKYLQEIWPEKKRLQIEYIKNKSFWLDLKIILVTLLKIIT